MVGAGDQPAETAPRNFLGAEVEQQPPGQQNQEQGPVWQREWDEQALFFQWISLFRFVFGAGIVIISIE